MKYFYTIILLCLIFCSSISFGGNIVETFNLKNGVKVILKQTDTAEIISLKFYSPISVLQEDIDKAGVTALLHNVMNKSTRQRNAEKLATDIENLGASISCDIEYDFSGFTLNCMSQYFNDSCAILADIILNPEFSIEEIEKEKQLMTEVIKSRVDSIKSVAADKFISDFYNKNHPYSYLKNGKIETLQKLTQQDLKTAYDTIYSSKDIIITVAGNISKSKLKKVLEKYFSSMKLTNDKINKIFDKNTERPQEDVIVKSKFNQAFIIYAYDAPDILNKDFATLKLINIILGGRMTGRLFIELREKLGLAYEVNSLYPSRKDMSYFEIYLGLDKKNIATAKKGIEKIIDDLCNIKVEDSELLDTKNFIKGVYLLDHQSVERQAYYLAVREILGLGYQYDEKYIDCLFNVTSDDIMLAANKYFKQMPYKLILMPD